MQICRSRSINLFSGGGGDMIAAEMAGITPVLAANHWVVGVETSETNFGDVDHLIGDLAIADPKKLPADALQANILFASPECDGWTMARNHREAVSRLGPYDPKTGIGRSRATVWCPMRFVSALPNLEAVIMEQVVDMARDPQAFADYVEEWHKLGWRLQAVSANSAFFGAPQSRDRLYMVATRLGTPEPDLEFRPLCFCFACEQNVWGRQTFKPAALKRAIPGVGPIGKYGPRTGQYYYSHHCPACAGEQTMVTPYIVPAWTAINWDELGEVIRDRATPLAPNTMARMRLGLKRLNAMHVFGMDHLNKPNSKAPRPIWLPFQTLTARQDMALACPPGDGLQVTLRNNCDTRPLADPSSALCASGNHLGLVAANKTNNVPHTTAEPAATVTSISPLSLVTPPSHNMLVTVAGNTYERPGYARAWSVDEPMTVIHGTLDRGVFATPDPADARPILRGEGYVVANYSPGHVRDAAEEPTGALTAGGQHGSTQQAVLRVPREALISSYYGGSTVTSSSERDPLRTQTARDRHAIVRPPDGLLVRAGGTRQADALDTRCEPSPTRMPKDNYALARGHGELPYELEDCTFRMLSAEECQATMCMDRRVIPQQDGSVKTIPYKLTGSRRDRVRLAGNGITPGVEAQISERVLAAAGY